MAKVDIKLVKQVREMTGAGPLDAKNALQEHDGDLDKAVESLVQKGLAQANKKLGKDREMSEGLVGIYHHHDGRIGAMVEVNCETDFVARNEAFQKFAKNLAMHIATMKPIVVNRQDLDEALVSEQRELLMGMDDLEGKPDDIKAKIVSGRLEKWYKDAVLMEQDFFFDDDKTVEEVLKETVAELGEKMQIARFARFAIGESTDDEGGDDE
jgi:elongation factor Ts